MSGGQRRDYSVGGHQSSVGRIKVSVVLRNLAFSRTDHQTLCPREKIIVPKGLYVVETGQFK